MDVEEARQHAATNQPNSFQPEVKRHAACDECRHRKLKCSGDKPRCGRCGRENISCVYSPQKQMGRPRKRRRDDVSSIALPPTHQYGGSGSHPIMMNDAAAATASPSTMAHMGGLSNGGVGINGHHGPFTPPAVSHQDLEALVASFDGGVSASGSNAGIPASALMYSGFEGFSFDADEVAAAAGATAGGGMTGFGNVFELEPGFSLDPILGVFGDDGAAEVGRQGTPFDQHRQSQSLNHSHSGQFSHEDTSAGGSGTCSRNLSIDGSSSYHTPPMLAQHHEQPLIAPPLQPQCACLSSMYLTMTSLHSLSNHDFPFVLPTLRSAINTIATVVPCPQCPKRPATATQNLHMLVSLLLTVVETVRSCLFSIDAEAARVEAAGATKAMAMADAEVPMHMHTDWRRFVRKALRDQIVGSPQYPVDRTLYGIVMSLENRQRRWHEDPELHRMRQKMFGDHAAQVYMVEPESRLCVKNIEHIRLAIDRLALDV
ncbi:hypothetical protein HDK90DRAFT_181984 [Phyllosticta capitalensis]|uniref:Zn(2)-C6 fungal-type domain-containing protein n=1 Tax=Phyllosticta capitalensis TaxID=121624 RepID=A0ABR1YVZ0_9PEZI